MTVCNITGWQCHCQPPEIPCDGLAELRKAYAAWRALAERRKQELSLAEEGLANYEEENQRLRDALESIYTRGTPRSVEWEIAKAARRGTSAAPQTQPQSEKP